MQRVGWDGGREGYDRFGVEGWSKDVKLEGKREEAMWLRAEENATRAHRWTYSRQTSIRGVKYFLSEFADWLLLTDNGVCSFRGISEWWEVNLTGALSFQIQRWEDDDSFCWKYKSDWCQLQEGMKQQRYKLSFWLVITVIRGSKVVICRTS